MGTNANITVKLTPQQAALLRDAAYTVRVRAMDTLAYMAEFGYPHSDPDAVKYRMQKRVAENAAQRLEKALERTKHG